MNHVRVREPIISITRAAAIWTASIAVLIAAPHIIYASDNRELDADVLNLSEEWAKIKYLSKNDDERKENMSALGAKADDLVTHYPGRAEALIWKGIIRSERASLTWGITALNLATSARDTLLEAEKLDANALDAGAPTTLGVLYYRVPAFPISWGDTKKARQYLKEAVKNAPNGREAHYYYADFLYDQGEYKKAEQLLIIAFTLPHHPERPIWDQYLSEMIERLLAKVRGNTQ